MALPTLAPAADDAKKTDEADKPEAKRLSCWVDLYRGEPIPFHAVLADLAKVRAVYLGESHGLMRHHDFQAKIVEELAKRKVPLVLALEQMEVMYQSQLDRFNRGEIDFDELAKITDWKRRWGGYEDYRGALEAARKAGMPVIALNARRETIRMVARAGGVDKLDAAMRSELPKEIVLDDPAYRGIITIRLGVHKMATPKMLRPMFEAQVARDEHMADVLSKYLESDEGKGRTAVVLCGSVHCQYGLGTVSRVRRRMPGIKDRIVLMSASGDAKMTAGMKKVSRPITVTHEQLRKVGRPIADYLHVISRKEKP
jgi:uncharacterized iron-regulated protein